MLKASDLYESSRNWIAVDPARALRLAYAANCNIADMDVSQHQIDNLIGTCYTKEPVADPETAIYYFKKAIFGDKKCEQYKTNLAHAYLMDGEPKKAEEVSSEVLKENPGSKEGYVRLFNAILHQGRYAETMSLQENAYRDNPDDFERMFLGLTQLTNADIGGENNDKLFLQGVENYKARVGTFTLKVDGEFIKPSEISGKDIIILLEQGLGDCVMMIPYIQLAACMAKSVDVCSLKQDAAIDLFRTLDSFSGYSNITFHKSTEETQKRPMLYMFDLMALGMPKRLWDLRSGGSYGNPSGKVGFCWRGNPEHPNDWWRSMRFKDIKPFIIRNGKNLVSLQSNLKQHEYDFLKDNGVEIAASIPDHKDLIDTVSSLRAVVSVDTFISHLAGALHMPCHTVLMKNVDWRWGISSNLSDWYYNHRLYRQEKSCDWSKPIYEVENELFG